MDALSLDDVLFSELLFSELLFSEVLFSEPLFSLGAAGLFVPLFSDSRAFLREAEG